MATATISLQAALVGVLTDDAPLMAILVGDGVHARRAPDDEPLTDPNDAERIGYIVLGASAEDDLSGRGRTSASHFGRSGHDNTETLRIWAADIDAAKVIYAEVERLLDGTNLTLDGHTMVYGRLAYVTDQTDPDGAAVQIIARYRAWTLEGV